MSGIISSTGIEADDKDFKLFMDMVGYARPSHKQTSDEYREFLDRFIEPVFGPSIRNYDDSDSYNYIHVINDKEGELPRVAYMAHHDTVHKVPQKFHEELQLYFESKQISDDDLERLMVYHDPPRDAIDWYETIQKEKIEKKPFFDMKKGKIVSKKTKTFFTEKITHKATNKDYVRPSCLGADCTTGIWIMLQMIEANVPGFYIIHTDEEVGRKGAESISNEYSRLETIIQDSVNWGDLHKNGGIKELTKKEKDIWVLNYINDLPVEKVKQLLPLSWWIEFAKVAISFDRKNVASIITHQSNRRCCSDEFVTELSQILSPTLQAQGYPVLVGDDGGSFTDSFSYIDDIIECTNLSVGYYSQHTTNECQDIDFMFTLRDALIKNGESLNNISVHRDPTKKEMKTFSAYGAYKGNYVSGLSGAAQAKTSSSTPSTPSNKAKNSLVEVPSELQDDDEFTTNSNWPKPKTSKSFSKIRDAIAKTANSINIITKLKVLGKNAKKNPDVDETVYTDLELEIEKMRIDIVNINNYGTEKDISQLRSIQRITTDSLLFMSNFQFDSFYDDLNDEGKTALMYEMICCNFREAVVFWEILVERGQIDMFTADWFFDYLEEDLNEFNFYQ